jgi:hypothetical protein
MTWTNNSFSSLNVRLLPCAASAVGAGQSVSRQRELRYRIPPQQSTLLGTFDVQDKSLDVHAKLRAISGTFSFLKDQLSS